MDNIGTYFKDDAKSIAVGDPHGLELVVDEGELGAVLGEGREHAGHPEEPHILVRRRGLQLVEGLGDNSSVLYMCNK